MKQIMNDVVAQIYPIDFLHNTFNEDEQSVRATLPCYLRFIFTEKISSYETVC